MSAALPPLEPDWELAFDGPSIDDMHRMALEAYELIPAELRRWTDGVVFRVAEWPDPEVLDEMGLASPYDLLGLYQGVAIDEKSVADPMPAIDMIFLYRQPILAYREDTGHDLDAIIRNTMIHEIGHHFGLSDEEMDALEEAAERDERARVGAG
jgi:predicted Zn-dependent protease with MMP-like domain